MPHLKPVTPAQAIWNQRDQVLKSSDRLRDLCEAVDWQNDLSLSQWTQWFTLALEFQPDLIIELGRGRGNSTCLFTEAANQLGNCRVVSFCLSTDWDELTKPRVAQIVPDSWFDCLEARIGDLLATDVPALLGTSQRILLLWDAHGYEIADFVLGAVLPLLKDRVHLVVMHDISDTRYAGTERAYRENRLWRGNNDGSIRLVLGHLNSAVEQAVAIVDFTSRNHLTLHSSDHSLHTELTPTQTQELQQQLGEFFSICGHWFYFSLNEKPDEEPIYFPAFSYEAILQDQANRQTFKTELQSCQQQLEQTQSQFQQLKTELEQSQNQLKQAEAGLSHAQAIIAAMESSKFWQLRKQWFQLKKAIGLSSSE
ncbi:class I SAM-dependent methyltransferase [Kovacikia minuta CCNUW1]|uniref:class I SAM-dependent methyltransferase n=1 Tax=Kovacikia minuta TaxID=2931930 RepID=UPI001CCE3C9E|nr:class I SAM-dependent methyltransferase [Kovacikia minuta]UBF24115.1 class I SAM-dependent methyltransferase [Kovacikia minuta CCNUW1]